MKKTCKILWQGIHNIIYFKNSSNKNSPCSLLVNRKTLTSPESIAEEFNEFFTSSGNDLQKQISPTTKNFPRLFKVTKLRNITPTKPEEVSDSPNS